MQKIRLWIISNYNYPVIVNNESLVVDIDTDKSIARFTVWDDLSCVLEILDVDTEKYIINERRELSYDDEVIESFKEFHSLLN
ncbi:immunity protein TriTu family protein [Xenorhabdus bovienii]|uniref:immunity protein TriTu family protein n=1 Tax=Xenorhabdus bovienii TaxID=40576 RepID=UPI003DA5A94F